MLKERTFGRRWRSWCLLALLISSFTGCRYGGDVRPHSIEITRVPAADPGGPQTLDFIEGRVQGARPDDLVVLYAHSGLWWVQPFTDQVFTKIQSDASWKNSTHLGTEYAALLVHRGYPVKPRLKELPPPGGDVLAITTKAGRPAGALVRKIIHFSGYDWIVRTAGSDRGGAPNLYDAANAWVDQHGFLHLRMQQQNGEWRCAEVNMTRSLGFGTYRFTIQDVSQLAPSVVVGMYTLDENSTDDARNELDIELSRWGNPSHDNAQYVVQPFYVPENLTRFSAPPGLLTYSFQWQPGNATFRTVRGAVDSPTAKLISAHVFSAGIPAATGQTVHIDLYDFHHSPLSSQEPAEIVIEKFEYLP